MSMLLVLSPAKKLDFDSPVRTALHTEPLFVEEAAELIDTLREKSVEEVADLMKLSDSLAQLNVERYSTWQPTFDLSNSRQAVLAFNGDVYEGLEAPSLSDSQLKWAQEHVVLLSGLYGALRPLDLMQPYRLEMGTRLATEKGKNLYQFWGSTIADYLNERFEGRRSPILLNLASDEYFKAVDQKVLKAKVIQCVFQDYKSEKWKVISFYAKRARGLMARFVIENKVSKPEALRDFAAEGYGFAPEASTDTKLVFRRKAD